MPRICQSIMFSAAGLIALAIFSPSLMATDLLATDLLATDLLATDLLATDPPVKVYILSGQSNMVGIGQVNPASMTRYNTYVTQEDNAVKGATLSLYAGDYDPAADYDQQEPADTHHVMLGYWPHSSFPKTDGSSTAIARGFIRIAQAGHYSFKSASGSILEIDGQTIYQNLPDQKPVTKIVNLKSGTFPIKVTFPQGAGRSNLSYEFFDLPGTLDTLVKAQGKFPFLIDKNGDWSSRDDVWYKGVVTATANQWLSVGCGAGKGNLGPELGFGHVIGNDHDAPVLIIKASQGNRSLAWDFLPPGSERYERDGIIYAGYKDSPSKWEKGTQPKPVNWYAGKQYDDCVSEAHQVLDNFDENFPHWKGRGYEVAGFGWWQGHKDGGSPVYIDRYEQNLVNLIKAFRNDFDAPNAPFVVATVGFHGHEMPENYQQIVAAQLAVSGEKGKYPEFKGNVKSVDIRDYWRSVEESPKNQDYHYNRNAETYLLVGESMGKAMLELIGESK